MSVGNKMTGNLEEEMSKWNKQLEDTCTKYSRVLFLGDSMGATASLVFAEHATRVLAFCPQVDLFAYKYSTVEKCKLDAQI